MRDGGEGGSLVRVPGRVVGFDPSVVTVVEADDDRFFVFRCEAARHHIVDARCHHRGGPMEKAERCRDGHFLRCPWHECLTPVRKLTRNAIPAVFSPGRAAMILPQPPRVLRLLRRQVLANGPPAATAPPSESLPSSHRPSGNKDPKP